MQCVVAVVLGSPMGMPTTSPSLHVRGEPARVSVGAVPPQGDKPGRLDARSARRGSGRRSPPLLPKTLQASVRDCAAFWQGKAERIAEDVRHNADKGKCGCASVNPQAARHMFRTANTARPWDGHSLSPARKQLGRSRGRSAGRRAHKLRRSAEDAGLAMAAQAHAPCRAMPAAGTSQARHRTVRGSCTRGQRGQRQW